VLNPGACLDLGVNKVLSQRLIDFLHRVVVIDDIRQFNVCYLDHQQGAHTLPDFLD
jgi:hypothetical protein